MLPNRREPSPQWARLGSAGADEVNGGSRSGKASRASLPLHELGELKRSGSCRPLVCRLGVLENRPTGFNALNFWGTELRPLSDQSGIVHRYHVI